MIILLQNCSEIIRRVWNALNIMFTSTSAQTSKNPKTTFRGFRFWDDNQAKISFPFMAVLDLIWFHWNVFLVLSQISGQVAEPKPTPMHPLHSNSRPSKPVQQVPQFFANPEYEQHRKTTVQMSTTRYNKYIAAIAVHLLKAEDLHTNDCKERLRYVSCLLPPGSVNCQLFVMLLFFTGNRKVNWRCPRLHFCILRHVMEPPLYWQCSQALQVRAWLIDLFPAMLNWQRFLSLRRSWLAMDRSVRLKRVENYVESLLGLVLGLRCGSALKYHPTQYNLYMYLDQYMNRK